jgi:hypothetical protein
MVGQFLPFTITRFCGERFGQHHEERAVRRVEVVRGDRRHAGRDVAVAERREDARGGRQHALDAVGIGGRLQAEAARQLAGRRRVDVLAAAAGHRLQFLEDRVVEAGDRCHGVCRITRQAYTHCVWLAKVQKTTAAGGSMASVMLP